MTQPDQTVSDPRGEALAALRQATAAVLPYLATPEQRAELILIEAAVARLSVPEPAFGRGLREFDGARLSHLLELTGPALAGELLARLTEDLTATQYTLDLGTRTTDWKRLRDGSHVLISLAGSVGALSLHAMAEELNAIAHRQDARALLALMPEIAAELSVLIAMIRATPLPNGRAR